MDSLISTLVFCPPRRVAQVAARVRVGRAWCGGTGLMTRTSTSAGLPWGDRLAFDSDRLVRTAVVQRKVIDYASRLNTRGRTNLVKYLLEKGDLAAGVANL